MADLLPNLIVLGATLVGVVLIFWLVARNKRQRDQRLQTLASRQGWIFEKLSDRKSSGFRFRKGEWTITAVNETTTSGGDTTSSNVSALTRWHSTAARLAQGIVLIGPRQPALNLGGFSAILMQAALRLMIGPVAEDAKDIQELTLGSLALNDRFMIYTNQEETARKLLDTSVETALLAWPGKVPLIVRYSKTGLEVEIQGKRLDNEAELITLVKLGNALLEAAL